MAVADEVRYQQIGHGFSKLAPVVRVSAGWRRTTATENPDAIVSRVFGPNNFAVVVSGEIDGLTGLGAIGTTVGTPVFGRVVSAEAVLVNLQSYAGATTSTVTNTSLVALQNQANATQANVTTLTASTTATDLALQANINALAASLVGLSVSQLRRYAWSVAS